MAVTNTPIYPQSIVTTPTQIVNSTGTAQITIYNNPSNAGAKVENIVVTNTDTNSYILQIFLSNGTTTNLISTISIPASAGNLTTVPAVNLLNQANFPTAKDSNGNPYFMVDSACHLTAKVTVAVTSLQTISITPNAGNF